MKRLGIFIRGRNTAGVIADAQKMGVFEEISVVCRDGDNLREDDDILVEEAVEKAMNHQGPVTLIANGGTTAQIVPLVGIAYRRPDVEILDVQRDSVVVLRDHSDYYNEEQERINDFEVRYGI